MKKRLVGAILAIVIVALVVASVINVWMMHQTEVANTIDTLTTTLTMLDVEGYENTPEQILYQFNLGTTDKRITIIDQDGTVLADSDLDYQDMENHLEREEVANAFASGWGESTRYSSSTSTHTVYVAKTFEEGFVVRASVSASSITALLKTNIGGMVVAALVALLLALIAVRPVVNRVLAPLTLVGEALQGVLDDTTDMVAPEIKKTLLQEDETLRPIMRYIDHLVDQLEAHIQSLTYERNKINLILECTDEGHIVLDEGGRILFSNGAARSFLGLPQEEDNPDFLMARNLRLKEVATTALEQRTPVVVDVESYGTENRTLRLFASPVSGHDFEGVPVGASVLISDVTALKKAEGIRAEFTANVSHELRTPLTSIKGFTDMLRSGVVKSAEDADRFLIMMGVEVDRLIDLINDILRLSELEDATIVQENATCDMLAIAQEVVELLTPNGMAKQITLTVDGDPTVVPIPSHRIKELLVNLVGNGIKYNEPSGHVQVTVTQQEGRGVLVVSDSGIGIPPEAIDRVFERFYRVDKGRSRQNGGTGLGLAIVKHVVQLYGGTINLESQVGQGSTFTITFP